MYSVCAHPLFFFFFMAWFVATVCGAIFNLGLTRARAHTQGTVFKSFKINEV